MEDGIMEFLLKNDNNIIEEKLNSFLVTDIKRTKIASLSNNIMGSLLCKFIFSIKEPKKILILHGSKSNAINYMLNYLKSPIVKTKISHQLSVCTYKELSTKLRSKTIDKEILITTYNYDSIKKNPSTDYCTSTELNEILIAGGIFHYKISLLEEEILTRILQLEDILNTNNQVDDLAPEERFNQLFSNPKLNIYPYKTEYMKFHYSTESILKQLDYSFLTNGLLEKFYIEPVIIDKIFKMLSDIFKLIHIMINCIPPNQSLSSTECSNIVLYYNNILPFTKLSDSLKLSYFRDNKINQSDTEKLKEYRTITSNYIAKKTPTPIILKEMLEIPLEKNNNILILFGALFKHFVQSPIDCEHDFIIMNY